MGMNDLPPTPDDATLDDLAAYALDAHDPDDTTAIESHLLAEPGAARWEQALRDAAGALAAAGTREVDPPPDLRERVLAAARQRRPPDRSEGGASPVAIHRVEVMRLLFLLRALSPEDWSRPVDPPEFAGWSVHDVVVHLVANESLLARDLGVPVTGIPETAGDNEGRTAAAQARHRALPPARAVAELEAAAESVDDVVGPLDDAGLDGQIPWWGGSAPIRQALLVRAFETWTHADDIRRALDIPMQAPTPASLQTMTRAACGFVPAMLAVRGADHPDRVVRFRFPDLGAAWDVNLGEIGRARPAGEDPVDAEITIDAVDLCRGIGARIPDDGLTYVSRGDDHLARDVVDSLPALAVL